MIDKLINIALAEVGYLEKRSNASLDSKTANAGDKNYTKYARDMCKCHAGIYANGYAWCDTFVDWCFTQAFGADKAKKMLNGWSAYCPTSAGYFKNKRQWYTRPQKGDIIFFLDSKNIICHTGIVYDVDSNYVYTVEGNTSTQSGVVANGGAVAKKKYALNYTRIAGYGRPKYPKGEKNVLTSGNDLIWEIVNGERFKVKIDDVDRAVKALDDAKNNPQFMSLYWIIYKLVNGNE